MGSVLGIDHQKWTIHYFRARELVSSRQKNVGKKFQAFLQSLIEASHWSQKRRAVTFKLKPCLNGSWFAKKTREPARQFFWWRIPRTDRFPLLNTPIPYNRRPIDKMRQFKFSFCLIKENFSKEENSLAYISVPWPKRCTWKESNARKVPTKIAPFFLQVKEQPVNVKASKF